MIDIDWHAPVGAMDVVLACVPGLRPNTLTQWQARQQVSRRGAGKGKAITWHAEDVLEVATVFELRALGVLPEQAGALWPVVRGVMLARMFPDPAAQRDEAILLYRDAAGQVLFRAFNERVPSSDPKYGSGLSRPDAPDLFVMIRTGRWVDRIAERIALVAPHAVRGARS